MEVWFRIRWSSISSSAQEKPVFGYFLEYFFRLYSFLLAKFLRVLFIDIDEWLKSFD